MEEVRCKTCGKILLSSNDDGYSFKCDECKSLYIPSEHTSLRVVILDFGKVNNEPNIIKVNGKN
jgi:phage FluMu protein Com